MLKPISFLLLILFGLFVTSNAAAEAFGKNDSIRYVVHDYVLQGKLDSAIFVLNKNDINNEFLLEKIIRKEPLSYAEYASFVNQLLENKKLPYRKISDFLNSNVIEPKDKRKIDLEYVTLKENQVSKLANEVSIESASEEQEKLDEYIRQFEEGLVDVRKAKLIASSHRMMMYVIQRDVKNGKELVEKNLKEAEELQDNKLKILSLYYMCEFLIFEGKLDEYIKTCEKALELEQSLEQKSSYYYAILVQIVDAYIYKGGYNKRIVELLELLYSNPDSRTLSYALYAKFIGTLELQSPEAQQIFKQFQVDGLVSFCNLVAKQGKVFLNPNDQYQLYRELSLALQIHSYLNESIEFKDRTVVLIRKIYSQDLANSLADYKTKQAVQQKDIEISRQSERKRFYLIIATLIAGLLLLSVWALWRSRKQSLVLEQKNKQINKALKEKELLVREVHHRVKNNFQIVSSLLELQTKGIEDEKAFELANEGKNRVKSMALIHQKLYQTESGLIDFDEYIRLLLTEINQMYDRGTSIKTEVQADNIFFDVDTAIPLGLIVNELVTNAYKYAFKSGDGNLMVRIEKWDDNKFKLTVADDGPGFEEPVNMNKMNSIGLRLVRRLAKQLHGSVHIESKNGAIFTVVFKGEMARNKVD